MAWLRRAAALLLCALILVLPAAGASFPDVPEGSWYAQAVEEMTAAGLLTGCDDGSFQPLRPISAAEFITIAARCAALSPVPAQTGHWAAGRLQAALDQGWYDWDELPPTGEGYDQPISRQLAVKVLMGALLPQVRGDYAAESPKISDFSALNGRYYEPVLAAYAAGVVVGDQQGAFRPTDSLSRAEACLLFQRALQQRDGGTPSAPQPTPPPAPAVPLQGGVSEHGWLQVSGTQLQDQQGQPVVLRGMSTHGLQWYGQFASPQSMASTAAYGANVFRVAMYTGEGGYLSDPEGMKAKAAAAVDGAIQNDMYIILDWHILSDGNPMDHAAEAEAFFTEMACRYQDVPNVLYEICNEPNGGATWSGDVKPYAQRILAAIRAQSPQAVVLIGSPTWSQDIHLAAADPVEGENLMYTLHFYAGTHGTGLRRRMDDALAQGLPIFVSEWGTSRADGSGGVFLSESEMWLDFLAERGISWCNWSLCDKDETSAALRPGADPDGPWAPEDLSDSGRFVFQRFSS